MKMPNKEQVQRLREIYKPGTVLELTSPMEDPYHPLHAGLRGKCIGVDDAGQLMMVWSDGSTLSLIPDVDHFRIVKEAPQENGSSDEA